MLPFHLPDSYRDAVKTFQSSPGTEEGAMSKALFGWVLPASALGVDSSDSDDDKSQADDSSKEMLKQDKKPSTRISDEATIDTRELRFWRRLPTLREAPTDQDDEASIGTEGTAELESDDEWDDDDENDNDWDDTYSIDSSDDEGSLVGEDTYDSWFARTCTTLSSPGDYYFNPTPKDFPIVREPVPAKATEPQDKAEDDSPRTRECKLSAQVRLLGWSYTDLRQGQVIHG
jgi:hypothetical protein